MFEIRINAFKQSNIHQMPQAIFVIREQDNINIQYYN